MRYARERLSEAPGKKLLMVSEYSLMWLFKKNLNEPLCWGNKGKAFCDDVYPELSEVRKRMITEREFVNDVLKRPIDRKPSREQWAEFYRSRSYLPADFIQSSYDLMNQYGVAVATYTFDQDNPNSRSTWRWKKSGGYSAKDIPIRLNPLFVPQAVRGGSEREIEANPYFYDSFRRIISEVQDRKAGRCQ